MGLLKVRWLRDRLHCYGDGLVGMRRVMLRIVSRRSVMVALLMLLVSAVLAVLTGRIQLVDIAA